VIKKSWSLLPKKIRQLIVLVVGSTLIVAGVALIILPGPFTMPLVIAGLFILAIEFAWAETLLSRAKEQTKKVVTRKKPKA
jgi:Flp pilus assembly protein TadB